MEEYEYSFKVKNVKQFIEYCENNNYKKIGETFQNRVVYENKNATHIIARITTQSINDKTSTVLDFKNVNTTNKDLKISNESMPIEITENDKNKYLSMLETLEFYEAANNKRTRYEYEKDGVLFEIDKYENLNHVVAIEGNKENVDKVYETVKNFI